MTILVFRFGKIAEEAVAGVAAGMLRTQATSHVIRQNGGSNKKLLAEQTKFVLSHLPFVCGQYNYSVYSTVS